MAPAARVCVGIFLPLLLAGCEGSELTTLGPTPPDQGIVIYIHADFAGPSQALNVDVRDLTRAQGLFEWRGRRSAELEQMRVVGPRVSRMVGDSLS
jgi:hypothetical protein